MKIIYKPFTFSQAVRSEECPGIRVALICANCQLLKNHHVLMTSTLTQHLPEEISNTLKQAKITLDLAPG